jgi:hypothetical protein
MRASRGFHTVPQQPAAGKVGNLAIGIRELRRPETCAVKDGFRLGAKLAQYRRHFNQRADADDIVQPVVPAQGQCTATSCILHW